MFPIPVESAGENHVFCRQMSEDARRCPEMSANSARPVRRSRCADGESSATVGEFGVPGVLLSTEVRGVYAWLGGVYDDMTDEADIGPRCRTASEERRSGEGRQALPKAAPEGRP